MGGGVRRPNVDGVAGPRRLGAAAKSQGGSRFSDDICPPEVVAGTSGENEGSKKVKKKKNKKKGNLCGFKLRFNSKRLGVLGKLLSREKQRIIRKGPFGDLLDIQPFKVPHELIEFVVMHTNHILREFHYKNKSIIFSKLMVKRIFNVPSGDRPVKLLKKSDEHVLRNIYKEGNRAPIAHVIKLLQECSDEDEVMINRTWALIALATVVCPGTGNMVNLEYLSSLEDMSSVHEFSWDEHLLARAMEEVAVFQEKKRMQPTTENPVDLQVRSCLPMLAGLRIKRRMAKDEVSMRVGNGSKVDVIAVGTLPLHLP